MTWSIPQLSLSLAGLDPSVPARDAPSAGASARALIERVPASGVRCVQIDATRPGLRPRELDRSGRRDLAALLRRLELGFSGIDAFIPPEHLLDPGTCDRAVASILSALELAAELRSLVSISGGPGAIGPISVCVVLPPKVTADILGQLLSAGDRVGVLLADCSVPIAESDQILAPGVGLDPAGLMSIGINPVGAVSAHADRLACARVTDCSRALAGARCVPGSAQGRLDLLGYAVALASAGGKGWNGAAVLDLRGANEPWSGVRAVVEQWRVLGSPIA